jgi:hypothetical protein
MSASRLRTIALPVEHGGWGFLFEPILLGMLVAPSLAGLCYSLAVAFAFLLRRPLKLHAMSRARGGKSQRYRGAGTVAVVYGLLAAASGIAAVAIAGWAPAVPLLVVSPFALLYLSYDTRNRARHPIAEYTGPVGLAAVATSIALAAGWTWQPAVALWVLVMARTLPSIVYVRARLRLERDEPIARAPVVWAHALSVAAVAALWWRTLAPALAIAAAVLLAGRTALGLSRHRRFHRARQVGVLEIVIGLVYIGIVVAGYRLGL